MERIEWTTFILVARLDGFGSSSFPEISIETLACCRSYLWDEKARWTEGNASSSFLTPKAELSYHTYASLMRGSIMDGDGLPVLNATILCKKSFPRSPRHSLFPLPLSMDA